MFTNAAAILQRIQADVTAGLDALLPGVPVNLDEPVDLIYEDLPYVAIYPVNEGYLAESESQPDDKKRLTLRLVYRAKAGPLHGGSAALVCTPVINAISAAIKADLWLGGLASYVELQGIDWGNADFGKGQVAGSSLEVQVDYFIS